MMKAASTASIVIAALAVVTLGLVSIRYANPQTATVLNGQAAKATTVDKHYIALGDSVAAGVGLKDDSDSSACNRTNQSYPNIVAANLNYNLTNIACSGATLPAGIAGSQDVNKLLVKPQLQQLFALARPDVVSLTIGANDAQWTKVIGKCYTGQCGSAADSAAVAAALAVMGDNLKAALDQIKTQYALGSSSSSESSENSEKLKNPDSSHASVPPKPMVIVTGYHQVFPVAVAANCTDLAGIDAAELAWGRTLQTGINNVLQTTVKASGFASFAAINFDGHELCSADPWVQGLADKQPYHPTAAGQAAFARQVTKQISALTSNKATSATGMDR